ncbi:CRISPR-associated helicase/endonuclease Cas3 [Azotobacter chroococcum]|uniref:CRISPR-associated helicase, Cas3 family n=1 Tax=Azotobacter chroococcum NCIMB 8003 TaxID=1328314 RepID=A0A0C4WN97_9GAMM|nr:CRISPR-associated helicase/endonuclease Cas3 [Azotobacter chroococcum]AJE20945.1 CRISPR-associated helicase, Cas3 family [Azotobacter chroococcum NCIMB 8003]
MTARFSQLAPAARRVWAKSGEAPGHGLLAHLLDVAAVAEVLLEHEPSTTLEHFARQFGLPVPAFARHAAALAGLHDFGKAIPGFQDKWPEGRQADEALGLPFPPRSLSVAEHASASAALLWEHLSGLGIPHLLWIRHALQAISAHHGYHFNQPEFNRARPAFEPAAWGETRREIFAAYWAVLAPQGIPQVEALSLPAVQWLAGLTSVADWIGSNPDWFPQGEREDSLAAHHADACRRAERALAAIGWSRSAVLLREAATVDQLIGRIVQRPESSARPLQREADRLLDGVRGPALLLVEAPMGEGKTELAFLAHLRLQAANRHRGLYVALPTQATGNALFRRALSFLRAFAGDTALDMQLVHGGAALNDDVRRLHDIHGAPGENVTASAWFSQRRRPLLSPYGVGTVDQALFAALNVKHHFVRLWGLANRVVVLDEVHAYDSYTGGLIEALLRWLKALGSSVVLMSATLPAQRRAALLRAWGVADEAIPAPAYPRLLLADERGLQGATCESRPLPSIRLQAVGADLDSLADCALECLQGGGCGALIVNTVERAQALYLRLRERLGDSARLLLFHARFPADQRGEREREVLAAFGADGERPAGALLIATQVAEQSLDIDFDFMLTDLAPVDLLLQRAGRLHRHRRTRPEAHAQARLFVAGLAPERLPDLKGTGWEYVYDPYLLGRTWALLSREAELQLPQDIDRLVQAVYSEDGLPADLAEADRAFIEDEAYGSHLGKRQTEQMMALNVAIDPDAEPQAAYVQKCRGYEEGEEGLGLPNYTRLGQESVSLVPLHVVAGGWSLTADGAAFDPDQPLPDSLAGALHARQLRTSRQALVRHLQAAQTPRAFAEHPLLRHLKPLPLEQGCLPLGRLTVRLDEQLGLVYQSPLSSTEDQA